MINSLLLIMIPAVIFLRICLLNYKILDDYSQHLPQMEQKLGQLMETGDGVDFHKTINANVTRPRRNILIVSQGRSGSTIIGDMFNHHPSVFYLHEPLQTVQRLMPKTANKTYGSLMADLLRNIFRCTFDKSVVEDFNYFYRQPSHPRASYAIGSPPLCPYEMTDPRWAPNLCPPMTSESLSSVCRNNYQVNVAKILISRITETNIKNILAACNPSDVDCKIIFLVRDPRAVVPSARSVLFFADPLNDGGRKGLRQFSYETCQRTEENLAFIKSLPLSWLNRIMVQRYEDFAMDPLGEMSQLFKFADLPELENVKIWLNKTTHPAKKRDEMCREAGHLAFCTIDDASEAVNRWRWKVLLHEIDLIEHYCKHAMWLMGYKPIDHSYELMSNISVPLFTGDYEAKRWFKN